MTAPWSALVALCAFGACAAAMALAVACDVRARIIPVEACLVIAVAGAVFQTCVAGAEGLAAGALCGVVIVLACWAANRISRIRSGPGGRVEPVGRGVEPVGRGDIRCMAALSLATGACAPIGFALSYGAAALVALLGLATRRLSLGDGMPMAPFLALWLAFAPLFGG